jgi:Clp amino terminal domain, pathogenicity island component
MRWLVSATGGILRVLFERFTERARQVIVLAQEEARMLKHNYIGSEHILLGLLREEEGLAARVLESLDITVERVRADVIRLVGSGDELTSGQIPFTPRAKKVLELSLNEALSLGHNYIGTEHILLGLVRVNDGVAARVLLDFAADADMIRDEMIRMLSGPEARERTEITPIGAHRGRQLIDQDWLDGLAAILNDLAAEIRRELKREPDTGDLLLALACAPDTRSGQALGELGVDVDALWATIERIRHQAFKAQDELARRIEEARVEKERAIEAQQFQTAARLRDKERELTQQKREQTTISPEALEAIRRRLGLPTPPDPPTTNVL